MEGLLTKVLALAQAQGAEAEVFYLEQAETPVEFETNRLKALQTKALQGLALRVIHQGQLGFASTTDLSRPEQLVEAALQTSTIGDQTTTAFAPALPDLLDPPTVHLFPTTAQLVTQGQELIARLLDFNPDLLVSATFKTRRSTKAIATTAGAYYQGQAQTLSATLGANWVRGEDLLDVYSYQSARDEDLDFMLLVEQVKTKLQRATSTASTQGGTLPVIFTPNAVTMVFGGLLQALFAGQAVAQGTSPLADKVGKQLFDPRLSVYEDPSQGVNRARVDDEGTPTQAKFLVKDGVIHEFYWDRTWAKRAGLQPTGNGFRGGLGRPTGKLVNLCIAPGDLTLAEMIASVKEGIVVDQVLGAGQSNLFAGEFSVNLDLGYKIEHGEIVGRLKNTMVAGSLFSGAQALGAIGSQPEWSLGSAFVPPLLFQGLGVISRA
ncbi:TldD/PmbA family protein [Candidatus Cyanaurora vandensis]|uniref:TldD/PmbA family protein n=1 Tax=Candidatus Cyanaurora vandensis TaxID=2714958 RepID=UPI00257D2E55|nr:TldD/PmbA family protein [Candidatus Cyanaurora vandensis]